MKAFGILLFDVSLFVYQTITTCYIYPSQSPLDFKDKNGYILKMIHGTKNVSSQIVTAVSFVQNLPQMVESLNQSNSDAANFYKNLTGSQ